MPINFTMLAQNSEQNYITQACLCAMSIHSSNPDNRISLITNDIVPEKYKQLFDEIVEIPWGDQAVDTTWKINNRWKIIHATPYDNTIVLDTDMLVLTDIGNWWNLIQRQDLFFTSKVNTYRNNTITSTHYRSAFKKFDLPNLYSAFHYFRKCDESFYFYKWLELGLNNWEKFQGEFAGGKYHQNFASVDLIAAIISKILGNEKEITSNYDNYPTFTHMKTHCQDWKNIKTDRWQDVVGTYLNEDLELKIGNYRQKGIFHYTEKDFVTSSILDTYEKRLGI